MIKEIIKNLLGKTFKKYLKERTLKEYEDFKKERIEIWDNFDNDRETMYKIYVAVSCVFVFIMFVTLFVIFGHEIPALWICFIIFLIFVIFVSVFKLVEW